MPLEVASFISQLVATNPDSDDDVPQGDDHLRLIKAVLQATFPNSSRAFYFNAGAAKTLDYTVLPTDENKIFLADATGGAIDFELPTAGLFLGFTIQVIRTNAGANAVTLTPASGTINGAAAFGLGTQYQGVTAVWTGSTWIGLRFFNDIISGDLTLTGEITFEDVVTFEQGVEFQGPLDIQSDAAFAAEALFNALVKFGKATLTDAAPVTVDLSTHPYKAWTAGADRAISAPTGEEEGQLTLLRAIQDATGTRIPTFNAAYKFSGGTVVRPDLEANAETLYAMFTRGADDVLMIPLWMTNKSHIGFYTDHNLGVLDPNDTLSVTHNLGRLPSLVIVMLKAIAADLNYSIGDYIIMPSGHLDTDGGGGSAHGCNVGMNATTAWFTMDDDITVRNKSSGALGTLDTADWEVVLRIYS